MPQSNEPLGLMGRLAVHRGLITREQLAECLDIQGRARAPIRLGAILIDRGLLTEQQVEELAAQQGEWERRALKEQLEEASGHWATVEAGLTSVAKALQIDELDEAPGTGPSPLLLKLVREAWDHAASDIHLHAGSRPWFRTSGRIVRSAVGPVDSAGVRDLLRSVMTAAQRTELEERGDVDFAWDIPGRIRFRVNAFASARGLGVSLRLIPASVPSLADLALPRILARCVSYHQGLVLVTGPSGCGKTSTVAAMVRLLNEERRQNIICIEDPIEYVHTSQYCNVLQRQLGAHVQSSSAALRGALRQDPDVIVVGEMRDLETVSLAISAAETGHLVLGTMHTSGVVGTLDRLIGSFPAAQQLTVRSMVSESLRAVVSQRLVPRRNDMGRVPIVEIAFNTPAVANLIRDGRTFQLPNVIQLARNIGMCRFEDSLAELVEAGLVDPAEVTHAGA